MENKSVLIGVGVGLLAAGIIYLLSQNPTVLPAPAITSIKETTYKNDETMQIWRDSDGYITKTTIKRDAKTGG